MIDLHLHLDGSLDAYDIMRLGYISNVKLPTYDKQKLQKLLTVSNNCNSLFEYLDKFTLPLLVLQTSYSIEEAVYLLVKKLVQQGLCYAEIRFAPQLHVKDGLSQEEVVYSAVHGLKRGLLEARLKCQLILCCMRGDENFKENMKTVEVAKQFLGKGVCAIDLAGDEAGYPTDMFADIFKNAKCSNIPFVIHAGEALGADSVRTAVALGASRIGHGIHSATDLNLMKKLSKDNIVLETCFTSNLQTKAIKEIRDYPIDKFLKGNILVTVNTDNMTVSNTYLKREYKLLQHYFALEDSTLIELIHNSVRGAFLSLEEKDSLTNTVNSNFFGWLRNTL